MIKRPDGRSMRTVKRARTRRAVAIAGGILVVAIGFVGALQLVSEPDSRSTGPAAPGSTVESSPGSDHSPADKSETGRCALAVLTHKPRLLPWLEESSRIPRPDQKLFSGKIPSLVWDNGDLLAPAASLHFSVGTKPPPGASDAATINLRHGDAYLATAREAGRLAVHISWEMGSDPCDWHHVSYYPPARMSRARAIAGAVRTANSIRAG